MVKYGVLFEVRTEFLNNIYKSCGFKGKTLAVKNWTNVAMEEQSWQNLLRKARAHVGLSSR
jgi:hypothetical protein